MTDDRRGEADDAEGTIEDIDADGATEDIDADGATGDTGGFTLTRAQQRAARTIDRNVTVAAGAGTGKTTTLTERYLTILRAHLDGPESLVATGEEPPYRVPEGIDRITDPEAARRLPERIVVTTFTERAADDLKRTIRERIRERLAGIDDPERWAVWRAAADGVEAGYIDTTHGFCSRVLEEYAVSHPAVDPGFDVLEDGDAARLRATVAAEIVESEPPGTRTLAPVFDRAALADLLAGFLAEPDTTEAWIDELRAVDDPDAYDTYLVALHPLDADPKRLLDAVSDDLDTLCALYRDDDVTDDLGANPMNRVGDDLLDLHETLVDVDTASASPIRRLSLCLRLCDVLTTGDGGQYGEGTYYGNKAFRERDDPTATRFREAMDSVLDELAPETRPTDASLDPDRDARELLTALATLARAALDEYGDRKRRRGALDYDDLIGHTLAFLTDPDGAAAEAAAGLRSDLWYVMVDEFQDTNRRQWELARALTSGPGSVGSDREESRSGSDPGDPESFDADNLCVVGDVKQSIYRFRDADVTVFGDATDAVHAANAANGVADCDPALATNFRTLPEPLSAINGLFDRVFAYGDDEPYEAEGAPLAAGRGTPTGLDPVVEYLPVPVETDLRERYLGADHPLAALPDSEPSAIEATAIADRIVDLLNGETLVTDDTDAPGPGTRPVEPDDIAVLIRSRSDLKEYERGLRDANVPYTVVKGEGFFETPEIRALTALLEALADPTDDVALYAAARSPLCGLTDTQIGAAHDPGDALWHSLRTCDDPEVAAVVADLERWREYAGVGETPGMRVDGWAALADRILAETGYLTAIAADERGTAAVANVDEFRDKLRELDDSGVPTLDRVAARLSERASRGRSEAEANDVTGATGVRIMTVHEAKGQEYPVVVVPGLGKRFNDRARLGNGSVELERVPIDGDRRPVLGLNVPTPDRTGTESTLMRTVARDRRRAEERAEEKRVLYVACTRAEDHLVLTGRHPADEDHETGVAPPDPTDPASYRDWLQPALFGTDDDAVENWRTLETAGRFTATLPYAVDGDTEHGTITVRLPSRDERYNHDPEPQPASTTRSRYGYERPWEFVLSASDLSRVPDGTAELRTNEGTRQVTASSVARDPDTDSEIGGGSVERGGDPAGGGEPAEDGREVPAAIYGHAVHRLCETRPPAEKRRRVIEGAIREQHDRASDHGDDEYPESAYDAIAAEADAAIGYLTDLHADLDVEHTHDEYYIELDVDTGTVRGFIDHLVVTPDTYHVVDYKTDRNARGVTAAEFIEERAAHHRPQLWAYAAALARQDPTRDVIATLYFTDVEAAYTWDDDDLSTVFTDTVRELRSLLAGTPVRVVP